MVSTKNGHILVPLFEKPDNFNEVIFDFIFTVTNLLKDDLNRDFYPVVSAANGIASAEEIFQVQRDLKLSSILVHTDVKTPETGTSLVVHRHERMPPDLLIAFCEPEYLGRIPVVSDTASSQYGHVGLSIFNSNAIATFKIVPKSPIYQ